MTTEYLLYTQGEVAETIAQARQREFESVYKESQKLQEQLKANQRLINSLREKDKEHKNTLKTYQALLTTDYASQEYLRAHYKKRHAHDENEENIQLMANLLTAADKAGH